jgi:hypothetical protein
VKALYDPRNYYERVRILLAEYKEPKETPPLSLDVILAVARCFFWLGLIRKGRSHFWRVFLWTCLHKRDSIQNFLGLAILGYHFCRVHGELGTQPPPGPRSAGLAMTPPHILASSAVLAE